MFRKMLRQNGTILKWLEKGYQFNGQALISLNTDRTALLKFLLLVSKRYSDFPIFMFDEISF